MSGARFLPLLAVVALALGCRMPRETAAEVEGRAVTAAEFEAAVKSFTASFGQASPTLEQELPRVRRGVLERLVERELMLAEAERRGIRLSEAEIERAVSAVRDGMSPKEFAATLAEAGTDLASWRRTVERDLVLEKLQSAVTAPVAVEEPEISEWISRQRDRPALPEQVRASQILVRTEAEATEARRRILAGAPFAEVARQTSLSPDADRGGDLGYFARGQMPAEFDEVAFTLKRGQLSEVVETPYGYHLFLVTDQRPARSLGEADERAAIRATLLAEKREAAFRTWLAAARAKARIRYNRSLVPER